MNEPCSPEATRREFEAVLRLPRFASIEQIAADLRTLTDDDQSGPPATPEIERVKATTSTRPSLPSRAPIRS